MPPTVALIFMLSLLTFRLLTTVIHELGHAIPALLLTKDKVSVYMGSHGNPEKSIHFKIGRLECYFKFNLFYWRGGLCVMHTKEISLTTNFIVTISGPLLSLIVAGITILIMHYGDFNDVTTLILFALTFSCILDFLNNIFPNRDAIELHDGTITNNDGMQLVNMFKYRNAHKKYEESVHYFNNKEYEKAAETLEEVLASRNDHEVFYRLIIYSNLMIKKYDKAKKYQEEFTEKFLDSFEVADYINAGIIYGHFTAYEKSIDLCTKALKSFENDVTILNNRGYYYGLIDKHTEAIEDLDKVIALDKKYAFGWNNRGFSKLKLGQLEEGLKDIEKSLELDPENGYAYRNLGLYHFYKKDYLKALQFYEKAFKLDPETHKIQEYIEEVNLHI
ncbi:M50 family metallopeptidase [Kordia algicida OT-1]|uniref:Tetratricopeptide repeat family protein n=1 Tax=Kordia algicida OT-1 TaxID=391587 RepID=A9EBA3_9FLAO|nr:M50 family metallopeptidase [Kordia algicida]EDP94450.1 Tetratricopeptide repeat family protein [Kordia algicida OT-1]